MSCYFLSAADFHRPLSSVGNGLTPEERAPLQGLIKKTQLLFKKTALSYSAEELSSVVDIIYGYAAAKNEFAARILSEYIRYLRISIISVPLLHVKNSTIIIDVLVKNCGDSIHKLVGRRHFMKTFALVARRNFFKRSPKCKEVGWIMLDCMQGWGEAFSTPELRQSYPNFYAQYIKFRTKYFIPFGLQFDPHRVPIFLGSLKDKIPTPPFKHLEVDNSFCRIPSIQLIQQPQYSDDASDLIIFSPQSQPDAPFGLYAAGNMSSFLASLPSDGLNLIANEQAANLATKIIPLDDLLFPYPNGTQDMVSHVEALESLPIAESKCVSSEIYDAPLRANTAVLPAHSWTTLFREYPDGDFIVEGDKNHSNSAVAIEKVEFFGSNRVVRR